MTPSEQGLHHTLATVLSRPRSRFKTFAAREACRQGETTPWIRDEVLSDRSLDDQVNDYVEAAGGRITLISATNYQIIGQHDGILYTVSSVAIVIALEETHAVPETPPPSSQIAGQIPVQAPSPNVLVASSFESPRSVAELLSPVAESVAGPGPMAGFGYRKPPDG
jgi:hypothetical protein